MRRTVIDFYLNKGNYSQLLSIVECSFAGFAGTDFGTPVNCCFFKSNVRCNDKNSSLRARFSFLKARIRTNFCRYLTCDYNAQ